MATTTSTKEGGIERQSTVKFVPGRMSFKEYDKKMRAFRPQNKYWIPVLTIKEHWAEQDAAGIPKFTADEIEAIKATDRNAVSTYIMGNGGETDTYTNGATAYDIRESLRQRYENIDPLGLSELTELYLTSVTRHRDECPDIWFSDIKYYMNLIVEAGGTVRTDKEIIAQIVTSASRKYDIPITIINSWPTTSTTLMVDAQNELRNYWRRNYMTSDLAPRRYANRNSEAYVSTTTRGNSTEKENVYSENRKTVNYVKTRGPTKKPWKKFKGTCNKCGAIGHKGVNCPEENKNRGDAHLEKRTCYNCGKIGHLASACREPKNFRKGSTGTGTYVGNIERSSQNNNKNEYFENEIPSTWDLYETKQNFVGMATSNMLFGDSEDENEESTTAVQSQPENVDTKNPEDEIESDEDLTTSGEGNMDNFSEEEAQEDEDEPPTGYFQEDRLIVCKKPRVPFPNGPYARLSFHCYNCGGIMSYKNDSTKLYNCYKCDYLETLYKALEHNAGLYIGWCPDCENIGPALHNCYYCLRKIGTSSEAHLKKNVLKEALYAADMKLSPARRAELHNFIKYLEENVSEQLKWKENLKNFSVTMTYTVQVNIIPCDNVLHNENSSACRHCQKALQVWKNNSPGVNGKYEHKMYMTARIRTPEELGENDEDQVQLNMIMTTDRNTERKHVQFLELIKNLENMTHVDVKYIIQKEEDEPKPNFGTFEPEPKHRFRDKRYKTKHGHHLYRFIPVWPPMKIPLSLLHPTVKEMRNGDKYANDLTKEDVKGDPDNLINSMVRHLFETSRNDTEVFCPDRPGFLKSSDYRDLIEGSLNAEDYIAYEERMYATNIIACPGFETENYHRPLGFMCSTVTSGRTVAARRVPVIATLNDNPRDVNRQGKYERWLFDTGSNVHATNNEHLLTNLKPFIDVVSTANGHQVVSTKRGDLKLKSKCGNILILKNVLVIPEFTRNIISGSCFVKQGGHEVHMSKDGIHVKMGQNNLIMFYSEINHLWFLYGKRVQSPSTFNTNYINNKQQIRRSTLQKMNTSETAQVDKNTYKNIVKNNNKTKFSDYSTNIIDINLAHILCGHMSEEVTKSLLKSCNVKWSGKFLPCPDCMKYKATAKKLGKFTKLTATKAGERIHIDTSGPFPKTLGGNIYWVKIKDQFSKYSHNIWVKRKSDVPQVLVDFLDTLKGTGMVVRYLRLDNAGEHSDVMKRICHVRGITLEYTSPYTPQMNGLVERQFPTDLKRAQAMMESADLTNGLKNILRAEAVHTVSLLDNLTPSPGETKSKYEKFFGKKSPITLKDLVIFGRIGYKTLRHKIKGKLKPKAMKCMMVGYAMEHSTTTYRLYMFDKKVIHLSRDVNWTDWQPVNPKSQSEVFNNRAQILEKLANAPAPDMDLALRWDETPFPKQSPQWNEQIFQSLKELLQGKDGDDRLRRLLNYSREPHIKDKRIDDFIQGESGKNDEYSIQEELEDPEDPDDDEDQPDANNEVLFDHMEDVDVGEDELEEDEEDVDIQEENPTSYNQYKRGDRELRGLGAYPKQRIHPMVRKLNTHYNKLYNNSISRCEHCEKFSAQRATYSAIVSDPGEPTTIKQAMDGPESKKWAEAIKTEIKNFMDRKVWKKVSRKDTLERLKRKLITTKWIFKKKVEIDNSIRYKARCVSRGFMQIPGVDFTESFAPVASDTAIRVIIGVYLYYNKLNTRANWVLEMFDVEAAFLNADLLQPSYIEWPQGVQELGFISSDEAKTTCVELTKAMYGNIDSPLRWMKTFTKHLVEILKLVQSKSDPCIFYKHRHNRLVLVLALYVDDTLCAGEKEEVEWAYKMIEQKFAIKRLGKLKKHLGVNWTWHKDPQGEVYLKANINTMVVDISAKFLTATGKLAKAYDTPALPNSHLLKNTGEIVMLDYYRSLVGMLMYLTTKVYPELSNSVRELASHLATPGKDHWKALERCIGYISNVKDAGQVFRRPRELRSISDCDSNYARDENDRKSISGRINTLGGMITNWTSKKQSTVSLSSTEAEYQALSECVQEAIFTQSLIQELTGECNTAIIYEDNIGAIFLVKNQQVSARTKHIDVRHHYMRDLHESKRIEVRFKRTDKNSSDILTKNTPKAIYEKHASTIRDGTLSCWKEDVKADTPVSTLTPKDESLHESS